MPHPPLKGGGSASGKRETSSSSAFGSRAKGGWVGMSLKTTDKWMALAEAAIGLGSLRIGAGAGPLRCKKIGSGSGDSGIGFRHAISSSALIL